MHSIRIDRINRLVEQRVAGTPDVAEIETAGAAMRQAIRTLGAGPGAHLSLYDLTGMDGISDAIIASAMQQWADPRFTCVRARKVAMVVPSALARLKLGGPASRRDNMALFADRATAMKWLFA